jgi:fructose-6-phosphate aldolase 2
MEYLLDTANLNDIKTIMSFYSIDGITTNPTIISREEGAYLDILKALDNQLNGLQFHIQLTAENYEDMIEEAGMLEKIIQSDLHIKIPVSKDGLKAVKTLANDGYKVTATAVTSLNQGLMAAKAGATYLAFYVNRTSNTGINGNDVIQDIKTIFKRDTFKTKIIGASYKSVYQVNESIIKGCDSVTVPLDLFNGMVKTSVTKDSIKRFTSDFKGRFGHIGPNAYKE